MISQGFLENLGVTLIHAPKLCAGLVRAVPGSVQRPDCASNPAPGTGRYSGIRWPGYLSIEKNIQSRAVGKGDG